MLRAGIRALNSLADLEILQSFSEKYFGNAVENRNPTLLEVLHFEEEILRQKITWKEKYESVISNWITPKAAKSDLRVYKIDEGQGKTGESNVEIKPVEEKQSVVGVKTEETNQENMIPLKTDASKADQPVIIDLITATSVDTGEKPEPAAVVATDEKAPPAVTAAARENTPSAVEQIKPITDELKPATEEKKTDALETKPAAAEEKKTAVGEVTPAAEEKKTDAEKINDPVTVVEAESSKPIVTTADEKLRNTRQSVVDGLEIHSPNEETNDEKKPEVTKRKKPKRVFKTNKDIDT